MKEQLYEIIREAKVAPTAGGLSSQLMQPAAALQEALDALCAEGRVVCTRKGRYALPESVGLIPARIGFQRNGTPLAHPFAGGEGIPVLLSGALRPMPEDRVLVRMQGEKCTINQLLSRGKDTLPAYVRIERRLPHGAGRRKAETQVAASAVPCDPRIPYDIQLTGDLSEVHNDDLALLRILRWPEGSKPIQARVERVLGKSGSMLALMKAVAEAQGFATERPADIEPETLSLPDGVTARDLEDREDLRGLLTFTIDGATAKDFDDAVSIEKTERGWRLGVHIADVSHYVRPGSAIDADALRRGTSLYLPGYTVAMLPECLSNNLCSLMPDVDRLAMSLFMDIENGRILDHHLAKSVIHSHARLTYAAVNRLYDGEASGIAPEVCQALFDMHALSHALRSRRHACGAIDFELDEPEFVLNEKGEPEDVLMERRGEAERIIEDFMLAANETVAALARSTELPFVYRVHEPPDSTRLHSLEAFLSELGLYVRLGAEPHPGVLQGILEQVKDHPARDVIRRNLLRALKKAQYDARPLGHYALSLEDYCHFTSPIRRYPDLTVHRMLKRLIEGTVDASPVAPGEMASLARECSQRESASVLAERQANDIMYAAWMSRQGGRAFDGVVSSVTGWGLYVQLENGAEGLVHIATLDDYYVFNRDKGCLVGDATGAVFKPGDRVRVRPDTVNVPLGEINFVMLPPKR